MPIRFFLTHSWKDIDFARRLRNDLVASGVDGFFDAYSIQPGDIISLEISRGLEACDIYVPILSHAALQSPWCEEEIHAAITLGKLPGRNGRPRIVPVLVEDCVEEMPILLRSRLYIEFAGRYDEALEELLTKTFGIAGRKQLPQQDEEPKRQPRKRKAVPAATGAPGLKSASEYNSRGADYYNKGDLDRALLDYNQALSLDPKYAFAYYNRGIVYKAKGDLDRALADYTQALSLNPKDADVYYGRGTVYYAKGDLERALADYNQALSLNPKYADVYYNRGIVYKAKGDLERALADYTQSLSLNPKDAYPYNGRGSVYYDKGDFDRALADYNQALSLDPKFANAYHNRGLVYRQKGSKAQAIADFQTYMQLKPNAPDRAEVEQWIRELKR